MIRKQTWRAARALGQHPIWPLRSRNDLLPHILRSRRYAAEATTLSTEEELTGLLKELNIDPHMDTTKSFGSGAEQSVRTMLASTPPAPPQNAENASKVPQEAKPSANSTSLRGPGTADRSYRKASRKTPFASNSLKATAPQTRPLDSSILDPGFNDEAPASKGIQGEEGRPESWEVEPQEFPDSTLEQGSQPTLGPPVATRNPQKSGSSSGDSFGPRIAGTTPKPSGSGLREARPVQDKGSQRFTNNPFSPPKLSDLRKDSETRQASLGKVKPELDPRVASSSQNPFLERIRDRISPVSRYKKSVKTLFENQEELLGVPLKTFRALNMILRGLRRGEMTVITGNTGVGKTTFVSQISLDYLSSGVPTLWGSFEIPNLRLIQTMLGQIAGHNLIHKYDADVAEGAFRKLEELPLYFMNHFGATMIDDVLDSMAEAVDKYGIRHIIVDNLQFMLPSSGKAGAQLARWELADHASRQFRAFASYKNVHITLVVHPKKTEAGRLLDISSVGGTSTVTQEADNVILLQKMPIALAETIAGDDQGTELAIALTKERLVDVRKNRFTGTLGIVPLTFDQPKLQLAEISYAEYLRKMKDSNKQGNAPPGARRPPPMSGPGRPVAKTGQGGAPVRSMRQAPPGPGPASQEEEASKPKLGVQSLKPFTEVQIRPAQSDMSSGGPAPAGAPGGESGQDK